MTITKYKLNKIFETLKQMCPEPRTELTYKNNYQLLIAVVLSAQATDISVNKVTDQLFKVVRSPEELVALGLNKVKNYIKSIGLFNTKAKNILALSLLLVERHNSEVPNNFAELILLPGVGEKTAKVVLNEAFRIPTIAVDTHIFRVSHRLGLSSEKNPDKLGRELEKIVPKQYKLNCHHWLILHGRYICKARTPLCDKCIISSWCKTKRS